MRQKVALAGALVHEPRLIILDEPLTGLDAGSARQVKNVLRERVAAGGTVIMTTHILEVAERMADRIGVIAGGRLIAAGHARRTAHQGRQGRFEPGGHLPHAGRRAGRSGVSHPASLAFLAHHEFRLAWRDWWSMLTAGKPHRARVVALALVAFALFMHLVAFSIVAKFAEIEPDADRGTLVVITGCALLAWSLMMSQAMESVTRAFYARSDLDLILSSPVASRRVFAVRIATMAASTMLMAVLLAAPFINILIWRGGAALARGLWRRDRGRRRRGGAVGRADGGAVSHHRAEADAARRADRRGDRRRHLRDRPADRRDPVLRHAVVFHLPEIGPAGVVRAGDRERGVVAGARGAGRHDRAASRCSSAGLLLLGRCHRAVLGALRRPRHRRRRRLRRRRDRSAAGGAASAGVAAAGTLRRKEWTLLRPRSLARLADADAAPLSAAARR